MLLQQDAKEDFLETMELKNVNPPVEVKCMQILPLEHAKTVLNIALVALIPQFVVLVHLKLIILPVINFVTRIVTLF